MLDLNTITRTNIDSIDWEDAPTGFDQSGTFYAIQVADLDGIRLILGHDIDAHKSSLAAEVAGRWYDTRSTRDWPVFDHLFGRNAWQELVADHQEDALTELADDEDEE